MTKSLSAREIVTDALSLIGKFTINDTAPEGHHVIRGLDWLDKVLAFLVAERWVTQLLAPSPVTLPLKNGVGEYELSKVTGPRDGIIFVLTCSMIQGGSRRPFDLVRLDEWTEARDRASSTGLPMFGFLDRSDALRLRVWPVPTDDTASLEMEVCTYPPTVAASPRRNNKTGNVPIGLRPEWALWASYQLAYHLGNGPIVKLPQNERAELLTAAEKYKSELETFVGQEMPVEAPIAHAYDYVSDGIIHTPQF